MSATSSAFRGRHAAESLMQTTGTMYAPTGYSVQNSDGEEVRQFATVFTSVCKIQGPSSASSDTNTRTVEIGGVERPVIEAGLHLPISDRILFTGWEFEVDELGPADDPLLLGKRYRVVGIPVKSYATARRLDVVEV